jgi:NAD(P)-dependent dehydrogenase (short-subunit alcohol dehydrogenase family)
MKNLKSKKVLVTGAAKGIGRGIAISMAEAGADVAVHYNSTPAEAEELAEELRRSGCDAWTCRADISDEKQIFALFDEVEKRWGRLDAAVNNAGWDPGFVPLEKIDAEFYRKLSDINIKGTLFCCLKEIELMKKNGQGSIINIGSVQMDTSVPGRTLYAMSKGAIHALSGQLALEAGPMNIRVNNLAPGYVEVERMMNSAQYDAEEIGRGIPVGRVGKPEDIGSIAVFLASDASGFINGHSLIADGGVHRKLARYSVTD